MSHFLFAGGGGKLPLGFQLPQDFIIWFGNLVILFEKCLDESIYLKAKYNDMQMIFTKISNRNRGRLIEKRLWHQAKDSQGYNLFLVASTEHPRDWLLKASVLSSWRWGGYQDVWLVWQYIMEQPPATRLFMQMHRWLSEIFANGFLRLFSKTVAQQCFSERLCVGP